MLPTSSIILTKPLHQYRTMNELTLESEGTTVLSSVNRIMTNFCNEDKFSTYVLFFSGRSLLISANQADNSRYVSRSSGSYVSLLLRKVTLQYCACTRFSRTYGVQRFRLNNPNAALQNQSPSAQSGRSAISVSARVQSLPIPLC
jgi:hypothetical protein